MRLKQSIFLLLLNGLFACGRVETQTVYKERQFHRCGPMGDRICGEEEKSIILDLEYLANKLRTSAAQSTLLDHFHIHRTVRWNESANKNFSFFGENHTDLLTQLDNFAVIERKIQANDLILFEGYPAMHIEDCTYAVLTWLRCSLEWARLGKTYEPREMARFCQPDQSLWTDLEKELEVGFLKLKDAECRGWDMTSGKTEWVEQLRERNKSLVDTMQRLNYRQRDVFIIAGYFHSPVGEYYKLASENSMNRTPAISDLYRTFSDLTSTEEIYYYLGDKPTEYFSHKRLIRDPKNLPKRL